MIILSPAACDFIHVRRQGKANFGDAGVFIEKYVQRARHIEVQMFGDGEGNVITFVERECSIQRRHQKIVEETPSPYVGGLPPTLTLGLPSAVSLGLLFRVAICPCVRIAICCEFGFAICPFFRVVICPYFRVAICPLFSVKVKCRALQQELAIAAYLLPGLMQSLFCVDRLGPGLQDGLAAAACFINCSDRVCVF